MPLRHQLAALVLVFVAPSGGAAARQESPAPAVTTSQEGDHVREPATDELAAWQREALELVRFLRTEDGEEAARELLGELVQGLGEASEGEDSASVAYLKALDEIAQEFGSLDASLRLREEVLELQERRLPPDHPDLLGAMADLATVRRARGDPQGARDAFEALHEARTRLLSPDDPDLLWAKQGLAVTLNALGEVEAANELFEVVHEARARGLPADDPELVLAKRNLAVTRSALGDLEGALELEKEVLEVWTYQLPPDDPNLAQARLNLAVSLYGTGDVEGAGELLEAVHEARVRTLPPDHGDLLAVTQALTAVRRELGDLQGALELDEAVHASRKRLLPPDHPELLTAKRNLIVSREAVGDLHGALEMREAVYEALAPSLPADGRDFFLATHEVATARHECGDLQGARELYEAALEAGGRILPPEDQDLLAVMGNLAVVRNDLGDLQGAFELEEAVLKAQQRLLPAEHPDLLLAMQNLAGTKQELGDLLGAHELYRAVHDARTRALPPDDSDLLAATGNLALTTGELGDVSRAHELEMAVLEARQRQLPAEHPDLLLAMQNLGTTKHRLDDFQGAHELHEAVLEARSRSLPPEHPDVLGAMQNLAVTAGALGDRRRALELLEEVRAAMARFLPADHPDLLTVELNLAETRFALGHREGAREAVSRVLGGIRLRATALRAEATRPAREGAWAGLVALFEAISLSMSVDPKGVLHPELFAALESLRLASVGSGELGRALAESPALARDAREIAMMRTRLGDLVAGGPADQDAAEAWRAELLAQVDERDRAERDLRRELAEESGWVDAIDAESVGAALDEGSVTVSYLGYWRSFEPDPATGKEPPGVDSFLAFVVRSGGEVELVELGPSAELASLVTDWRAALGHPLGGRGVPVRRAEAQSKELESIGLRLREWVLDPVLAYAGGAHTLHVLADEALHLVPLDALPFEGGFVGERYAIRQEVSLSRLLRASRPVDEEGALVLAGAIDYAADVGGGPLPKHFTARPPAVGDGLRSINGGEGFAPLAATTGEVRAIEALYAEAFGKEARVLVRADATKAALCVVAPDARFLHLATHGWFAGERFASQLDVLAGGKSRAALLRAARTLTGFAPETLCGLAVAGANAGRDAHGRVPGILTAEELATLDLRGCELAVLSACETNVGVRRAGQGIQSLQTALHAAGARTAITSLWKVDDAATRKLMDLFYTYLWIEKLPVAEALWKAKTDLRKVGHPVRDWAAWVLSGDPE